MATKTAKTKAEQKADEAEKVAEAASKDADRAYKLYRRLQDKAKKQWKRAENLRAKVELAVAQGSESAPYVGGYGR